MLSTPEYISISLTDRNRHVILSVWSVLLWECLFLDNRSTQSKVAHLQQDDFLTVTDIDMQSTAESLSQKTSDHLSVSLVQGKHSIGS